MNCVRSALLLTCLALAADAFSLHQQRQKRKLCGKTFFTNYLIDELDLLSADTKTIQGCVTSLDPVTNKILTNTLAVLRLNKDLGVIIDALNAMSVVAMGFSAVPYIGPVARIVKNVLNNAYKLLKKLRDHTTKPIADRIGPYFKGLQDYKKMVVEGTRTLALISAASRYTAKAIRAGRDCVCAVRDQTLQGTMAYVVEEGFGKKFHYPSKMLRITQGKFKDVCNTMSGLARPIYDVMNRAGDTPQRMVNGFIDGMAKVLEIINPFKGVFDAVNDILNYKFCIPDIAGMAREAVEALKNAINGMANEIGNGIKNFAMDMGNLANSLGNLANDALNKVKNLVNDLGREAEKVVDSAIDALGDAANAVGNAIGDVGNAAVNFIKSIPWRRRRGLPVVRRKRYAKVCFSIQDILNGINGVFSALTNLAEKMIKPILEKLNIKLPVPDIAGDHVNNFLPLKMFPAVGATMAHVGDAVKFAGIIAAVATKGPTGIKVADARWLAVNCKITNPDINWSNDKLQSYDSGNNYRANENKCSQLNLQNIQG